ncbi:MAG: signal peptidase I [Bdellovibrionales bacterium]|nr:signal peptidase I [Bdellovibrionales bacterium]
MFFRKKKKVRSQSEIKKILRDYAEALIIALLLALFVREYVLTAYRIPTASMVPTLKVGDFIFASKFPYNVKWPFTDKRMIAAEMPERGEVVVFNCPDDKSSHCIKRVVAVAGDRIQVTNHKVTLNGQPMQYENLGNDLIKELPGNEYYSVFRESLGQVQYNVLLAQSQPTESSSEYNFKVPEGFFYVLGDNRQSSDDSRLWGAIPVSDLQGRAWLIWLSLDWFNTWGGNRFPSLRWERLFQSVHDTQVQK